ncbi:hypothetical protein V4Y02_23690, partial [Escherichia coli]
TREVGIKDPNWIILRSECNITKEKPPYPGWKLHNCPPVSRLRHTCVTPVSHLHSVDEAPEKAGGVESSKRTWLLSWNLW